MADRQKEDVNFCFSDNKNNKTSKTKSNTDGLTTVTHLTVKSIDDSEDCCFVNDKSKTNHANIAVEMGAKQGQNITRSSIDSDFTTMRRVSWAEDLVTVYEYNDKKRERILSLPILPCIPPLKFSF